MSETQDAEITRELETLVAAKDKQQRLMRFLFILAAADLAFAVIMHRHLAFVLLFGALALIGFAFGIRAHLRAADLRGQAMEKILAEAFRRAGQNRDKIEDANH